MQHGAKYLWFYLFMACVGLSSPGTAPAENICAVCGKESQGTVFLVTDRVTDEQVLVCSDCIKLPRCFICGLPVKENRVELPDGRFLCARDAKTAVLKADEAEQICGQVKDELDRLFSRFTAFPTNVDVTVIDRVDVDSLFHPDGNDCESPSLLGCIRPQTVNHETRYQMRLLTGQPQAGLKATCAHEYAHAWVNENVPQERKAGLGRDAEEGFCELVAYLLMDSQQAEGQKKFILRNHFTRGQIDLFIEAEQRYGFDQVLDWMQRGLAPQLEAGRVDELRDVKLPAGKSVAAKPARLERINKPAPRPAPAPATPKLEGILWGNRPVAVINGRSFFANDLEPVPLGATNVMIRCLEIRKRSVRIQDIDSGREQDLSLPPH